MKNIIKVLQDKKERVDKEKVIRLLTVQKEVCFVPSSGFFSLTKNRYMKGVVPFLQKYVYSKNGVLLKRLPPGKYKDCGSTCMFAGKGHGTLVHNAMTKCTKQILWDIDSEMIKETDCCVERLLYALNENNWVPIASEYIVYYRMVATAIDMLVIDIATQHLIAIEIKTGYEDERYDLADTCMQAPFSNLVDSYENRHKMQLLLSILLFEITFKANIDEAYILRTCSKERGVYKIPVQKDPQLLNYLWILLNTL